MPRISVEPGLELNCEVDDYLWPWTHATPVLIHHGFCRNATFWRDWIPPLSASRRVYRPEFRGCGKSDIPARGYTITPELVIGDVVRVLDAMGLERVHWVGEAAGSVTGIVLAATHPERVASLVLCDAPVVVKELTTSHSFGEPTPAEAIMKYGSTEWGRRTLSGRLDLDRASPELQNWVVDEMGKTPDYVGAAFIACFNEVETLPLLKDVKAPVLLLCGDKRQVSVDHQRIMDREISNVHLKRFEGYGAGVGMLAPERCAGEAIAFWESFDPSNPALSNARN